MGISILKRRVAGSDAALLREFARTQSQAAFDAIVSRHLTFVQSVCMRSLGDRQLAEDATQIVFLVLARKAATLPHGVSLSGWLFQAARLTSKDLYRRESTRRKYERAAVDEELRLSSIYPAVWLDIEPVIDDMLDRLSADDRNALLLRFYGDVDFRDIASELGISEQAARMRISRALQKIRGWLSEQGVGVSSTALLTMFSDAAARFSHTHPEIVSHVLSSSATSSTIAVSKGVVKTMWVLKIKTAAAIAVGVIVAVTAITFFHKSNGPVEDTRHTKSPYQGVVLDELGRQVTSAKITPIDCSMPNSPMISIPSMGTTVVSDETGHFRLLDGATSSPMQLAQSGARCNVLVDTKSQIAVGTLQPGTVGTIHLKRPASVAIRVVDAENRPVAGVSLRLSMLEVGGIAHEIDDLAPAWWPTTTPKTGVVEWPGLPQSSTLYVVATADGQPSSRIRIDVPAVGRAVNRTIQLHLGGYISGKVTMVDRRRSPYGFTVVALPDDPGVTRMANGGGVACDSHGRYKMGPIASGHYYMLVSAQPTYDARGVQRTETTATRLRVREGGQATANFDFATGCDATVVADREYAQKMKLQSINRSHRG